MKSTMPSATLVDMKQREQTEEKPSVSVVVPAYNEALLLENHLTILCHHMESLQNEYDWELIVVNDGSTDDTGKIAEAFARTRDNVRVLHHKINFRLGQALRFAFSHCRGDYVVTMDSDLSYSPEHIERLLSTIRESHAKIVLASPYMRGGQISNVPWFRKTLSICANKFLSHASKGNFSTLTGMVRAYDRRFLQTLNLKAMDMSINAEIIYKAMLLRARIVEIPAHLSWALQDGPGQERKSSIKIVRSILSYLLSGFLFRPFMFFILPGFALMLFSLYPFFWVFMHTVSNLSHIPLSMGPLDVRLSAAVAQAFQQSPHTFLIGGITLMLSIQLISLGIIALQNTKYFEELFHFNTTLYKLNQDNESQLGK